MDGFAQVKVGQPVKVSKILAVKKTAQITLSQGITIQEGGAVEPKLLPDPLNTILSGMLAQHRNGRITGDQSLK
jgi:hypothetical protein